MNSLVKLSVCAGLLLLPGTAVNAANKDKPVDTSPPAAPSEKEQEALQPEVNIIQRIDKTIEEYRINGHLYKIKIIPKVGPPYYLIDRDGDGLFETQRVGDELGPDLAIPQWVLLRW